MGESAVKIDAISGASPRIKPFQYEKEVIVTFHLTNAEGNVSHNSYASLFGEARELFGLEYIPGFAQDAGKAFLLKTREASYEFFKDFYFGDSMIIRIRVKEVKGASFVLEADFVNGGTGEIQAKGRQLIAFADTSGKPQRMPEDLRNLLRRVAGVF